MLNYLTFSAFDILVVPIKDSSHYYKPNPVQELDKPNQNQPAEIIQVSKKKRIWSTSTKYVSNIAALRAPKNIGGWDKILGVATFNVKCFESYVYEYNFRKNKWIDVTKGFKIGNSFSFTGYKADFPKFQQWLTKLYNDYNKDLELDETLQDSIPHWKKFVNNIKTFAKFRSSKDDSIDRNCLTTEKERQLRNQWLCNKPSTWILHNTGSSRSDRYLVFKMKDHVYCTGGYQGIMITYWGLQKDSEKDEPLRFEKYSLKQQKWITCDHNLPYSLENASVVVSSDESYAIFIGGEKTEQKEGTPEGSRIIIFEEERGFTLFENHIRRRYDKHISLILPA